MFHTKLTKEKALAFLEQQDLSLEEVSSLAARTLGPVFSNERISKQDEFEMFNKMAEIPGIKEYMRDTMSRDLKRFFSAIDPKQQDQVRGAFSRALYWLGLMDRKHPNEKGEPLPKLNSDRYAAGAD